jgi:hypothetical protein
MKRLTVPLMAVVLALGTQAVRAEHEKAIKEIKTSERSASEIIGKKVTNAQNEDLGKIQDIIVNVDQGTAPYAIIASGGAFNRARVAVPLSSLGCSPDGKDLTMNATKEQLQAASKTPTGAWAPVAETEWTKRVDAYYGEPTPRERYVRESARVNEDTRTLVRDPAPKGAELLMTPQDHVLCEKICEDVDVVHVRVQNGVTHLYGTVESEEARKNLETRVRSVQGVNKVESHLRVKNP